MKKDKCIIFIGEADGYNRIAKPLRKQEIKFNEAKKIIDADMANISSIKNLSFEIIIDDEGYLKNRHKTLFNGYQYLVGDLLITNYNKRKEIYEGLTLQEIKVLVNYLEQDLKNDINVLPLKKLISKNKNKDYKSFMKDCQQMTDIFRKNLKKGDLENKQKINSEDKRSENG